MRTVFFHGRLCLRHRSVRAFPLLRHGRTFSNLLRPPIFGHSTNQTPRGKRALWASLSPAAFVQLSEEDNGDGKTPEEHMLEASRAEIEKRVPDDIHGLSRAWRGFYLFVDRFIYEPIATGLRFLHLVVIFVPVIATIPVIWMGGRRKDQGNERTGTIWWYGFLVHAMERAGPAFIKVAVSRVYPD